MRVGLADRQLVALTCELLCPLLQEDSCNATQDHQTAFYEYGLMRDALNATG